MAKTLAVRPSPPISELKAAMFKAMAHPGRIRILEVLATGPQAVSTLQPLIGLEASHLSQQLGVLRRAGLLTVRREGSTATYEFTDPQLGELLAVAKRMLIRSLSHSTGLLQDLRSARAR